MSAPDPTGRTAPDDRRAGAATALPETRLSRVVDGAVRRFGSAISWFWLALMAVIVVNVFMKNALGQGSVRFEEIQWHIYAALFLLGLSYTMAHDEHVRVDVIYENFGATTRAWVDLIGIVVFLIPFLLTLLWFTWPFVAQSYADAERSASPAGLSNYWLIKSALPLGLLLVLVTSVSRLSRCWAQLSGRRA